MAGRCRTLRSLLPEFLMPLADAPISRIPTAVPLYRQLYFQVIVAITLGVALGHFEPEIGAALKPLGDAFIKLVR